MKINTVFVLLFSVFYLQYTITENFKELSTAEGAAYYSTKMI
jgi:hypothetical protein